MVDSGMTDDETLLLDQIIVNNGKGRSENGKPRLLIALLLQLQRMILL